MILPDVKFNQFEVVLLLCVFRREQQMFRTFRSTPLLHSHIVFSIFPKNDMHPRGHGREPLSERFATSQCNQINLECGLNLLKKKKSTGANVKSQAK